MKQCKTEVFSEDTVILRSHSLIPAFDKLVNSRSREKASKLRLQTDPSSEDTVILCNDWLILCTTHTHIGYTLTTSPPHHYKLEA